MSVPRGCRPGYLQRNHVCEKIKYPMIGTSLVPNVVNRLGCDHVHGKWNKDYGVCIQEENNNPKEEVRSGCTAPVKGVIVCWYMLDSSIMDDADEDETWLNAYFDISPVVRKNHEVEVLDDPIYDYQLSEYTPYCYWGHEDADPLYEIIKDEALSAAKEIKEGKAADGGGMQYCTPDGRPCSPHHPDAILMEFPERRELESHERKKPFQINPKGHSSIADDFVNRMKKSKDNPLLKFTTETGEKILVDNDYIYIRGKKYIPNENGTLRQVKP